MDEIFSQLQTVFDATFLDPVELTPSLSADQVEEWDSLTHISLVVAVEKEFEIRFRTGEVEGTRNIGEFAELIQHHLEENFTT